MVLEGKTAVITGAATGVGRHLALRFAAEGARILVADVQSPDETLELLRGTGAEAEHLHCDVADEQSVRAFGAAVRETAGKRLDVLVNCAGINGDTQLVADMPLERWERTLRVNLTGTMLVTRELVALLSGGCVLNVASNVAKRGLPLRADYVASKWALLGLTQTLALELASQDTRVNAVCPGPVEGDRIEQILQSHAAAEGRSPDEVRADWAAASPMNRFIRPDEVAAVALFLCSDQSSAMTGQALNVTGGFLMD